MSVTDPPERWCSACGSRRIVQAPHWHCEACGGRDLSMSETVMVPGVVDRAAQFRERHAEYFNARSSDERVAYVRRRLAERGESEEAFLERLLRALELAP